MLKKTSILVLLSGICSSAFGNPLISRQPTSSTSTSSQDSQEPSSSPDISSDASSSPSIFSKESQNTPSSPVASTPPSSVSSSKPPQVFSPVTKATLPTLNITGYTSMDAQISHNSVKNNDTKRGIHFANNASDLFFVAEGSMDNGVVYGFKSSMQSYYNSSPTFQQNYIFFNTALGTLQMGNIKSPAVMIQDASSLVTGNGAFDGPYNSVLLLPAFSMRGNDNIGDPGYSTKIVLYSPNLPLGTYGDFASTLKMGLSYTPNTSKAGDDNANKAIKGSTTPGNKAFLPYSKAAGYGLNNVVLGFALKGESPVWTTHLTAAYITDDSYCGAFKDTDGRPGRATKLNRTSAYQLGTLVSYRRSNGHIVSVAGGYLNNGKSRLEKQKGAIADNNPGFTGSFGNLYQGNSGDSWNAGIAYEFLNYKVSATTQGTKRKTSAQDRVRTNLASLGVDMSINQGLMVYLGVDYYKAKSNQDAVNTAAALEKLSSDTPQRTSDNAQFTSNHGRQVTMGAKISF